MPSLAETSVLVTRPAAQAEALCALIEARGGEAIRFPTVAIEPLEPAGELGGREYDLVVFVSTNAVAHGAQRIARTAATRIAAVGKATAAALAAADMPADIVPDSGFDSEALLAHPGFDLPPGARVLIVRGVGGRELLAKTLGARGVEVDFLEVYRRTLPTIDVGMRDRLEQRWADDGIGIVTATSVHTLTNLFELLTERGRELLRDTPLLAPSGRIAQAASDLGVRAECVLAPAPDDQTMVGTLEQWHARAR